MTEDPLLLQCLQCSAPGQEQWNFSYARVRSGDLTTRTAHPSGTNMNFIAVSALRDYHPYRAPSGTSLTVHNALRGRKPASSEERGTLRDFLSSLGLSRRLWGNMPCGTLKILALNPSMRTMTRNMVLLLGVKKSRAFARGPLPAGARFSGRMLASFETRKESRLPGSRPLVCRSHPYKQDS